jgi:predicted nucleic acid-binding protein
MTSLIVDASVAIKWYLKDTGSDEAHALRGTVDDLLAPELVIAEVGNAMWKRHLRGQIEIEDALVVIDRVPRMFSWLSSLRELSSAAMRISATLPHPIYDCFYLALAERERSPVVTADQRLLSAAKKLGTVEVRLLGQH